MKNIKLWILFLLFLVLTKPVLALNVQAQRVYMPGQKFISLVESKPKEANNLALQMGMNYALNPFEFGNSSTGSRIEGIVDHLFTTDFTVGYSFTDRFAVALNLPLHLVSHIKSFTDLSNETQFNVGDLSLTGLYTLLDKENSSAGFGLGLVSFVTLPTGVQNHFVGDTSLTVGALLVADVELNGHTFVSNFGFRFREEENFLNLSVGQEILYGLGYHHYLSQRLDLNGFLEGRGSFVVTDLTSNSSPFEFLGGVSKVISEQTPLSLKWAMGVGLGSGYSTPDFRTSFQVSYDYLLPRFVKKKTPQTKVVQTIETQLKELTIYYPTDGASVDPFYDQKISDIAQILSDHPQMGPLYIVSHTDDVATAEYNIALSNERSQKAYEEILKHGIQDQRVQWMGVGEDYPEYPNDSSVNRALNRRTVFTFQKPIEWHKPLNANTNQAPSLDESNDSYTEVLKEKKKSKTLKKGEYFEEEVVVKKVPVTETVEVKKKIKPKRKSKKDSLEEQDITESDGSESFEDEL